MEKAQAVKIVTDLKAQGFGFKEIADRLNKESVPTISGKGIWNKGTVFKLCKSAGGKSQEKTEKDIPEEDTLKTDDSIKELDKVRQKLDMTVRELEEYRQKNQKLESELADTRQANRDFLEERDQAVRSMEKELAGVSQKLDMTVRENDTLKAELNRVRHELDNSIKALDTAVREKDLFKAESDKVSYELDNIRQMLSSTAGENDTLKAESDRIRQELDNVRRTLDTAVREKDSLKSESDRVRHELDSKEKTGHTAIANPVTVPPHVDGWSVALKGDYYKVYKRIDSKLHWIHIGRKWNIQEAEKKIRDYRLDKGI